MAPEVGESSTNTAQLSDETPLLGSLDDDLKSLVNPTRSFSYILFLTVIIGGLQLSWSAELSNGSPFLQSLGISKTLLSLVWIAGPLSGTVGQPIVGVLSDECRWKSGRRGPFIIGGAIATIVSLLTLSWSKTIVSAFYGNSLPESELKAKTIPFAVAWVYILDFAIAAIQAGARALIVDNAPTHQQQVANAWAARMTGIGNVIGYALGSINLPSRAPWLGNTEFRALSSIASVGLVVSVAVALHNVRERDPNTDPSVREIKTESAANSGARGALAKIYSVAAGTVHAIRHLSPQSRLICNTQFFAWIGYFPLLFYLTTYVGAMYRQDFFDQRPADAPPLTDKEWDHLWEESTRKGTFSLVIYAITSLIASFLLPYLVQSSYEAEGASAQQSGQWQVEKYLSWLQIPGLTVAKVWTFSHLLFFFSMMATFWIRDATGAYIFVSLWGIVWAVSLWAPFTLIAEDISRIRVKKGRAALAHTDEHKLYRHYEHEAGIVMGVLNVYVSAPQVISSLFSSLIFKLASAAPEVESFGWVFRFGGLAALIATYLSVFIKAPKELDRQEEQGE